ncbi:MAG: hypothetical protein COA88_13795 [Kordia sp.]|nr:MAG: hypothetical protein COA88_13795 [Kordia sp.]
MKKLILLLLIFVVTAVSAQELALANKDGKFGYINKKGEWHIQPKFKKAHSFSGDYAIAFEGKKVGFINRKGEWVVKPTFDKVKNFDSGIAVVLKSKRWFYINTKGEEVFADVITDKIYDFKNGVAFIKQNDLIGLIDATGKVVIAPKFLKIKKFVNGYAKVKENEKWGLIDTKGQYFVKPIYNAISNVYGGNITAKIGETHGLVIFGEFKAMEGTQKIWDFSRNDKITYAKRNDKVGFINSRGNWIVEPTYDKVRSFRNGLAPVCKAKKWGYINEVGEVVIPLQFRDAELFSTVGLAPVKSAKLWGFVDKSGKEVIPQKYVITTGGVSLFKKNTEKGFINGLARVKYKKTWGFINSKGELLNDTWFINLEDFK